MMVRTKVLIVLLCSILIAGVPFGSLAADRSPTPPSILGITPGTVSPPPTITPPGNDGLLSSMTPGNYNIPTGWSMVRKQDFEGTCPPGEHCGVWGATPSTAKPHTGSKSLVGSYANDQAAPAWLLDEGQTGNFSELYLSFYEFIESQALFNDEFFLAKFAVTSPVYQEVLLDWYWAVDESNKPVFNGTRATLYVVPQGPREARLAGKTTAVPIGAWIQWEIHYRQNTPGNSNGFYRLYKDGSLYTSVENADINGSTSMNNTMVMVGGIYTKLVWMTNSPTCTACGTYPGDGTDYCTSSMGFSGQPFSRPVCSPIDPPLPSFKRYFDDIILMKK